MSDPQPGSNSDSSPDVQKSKLEKGLLQEARRLGLHGYHVGLFIMSRDEPPRKLIYGVRGGRQLVQNFGTDIFETVCNAANSAYPSSFSLTCMTRVISYQGISNCSKISSIVQLHTTRPKREK